MLLGGAAAAAPLAARAQQRTVIPVVGVLYSGLDRKDDSWQGGLIQGLRELGYIEGQNIALDYSFDDGTGRAPELAAELVRRKVAVIVAAPNTFAIRAAKDATQSIPVVFMSGPDPVRTGVVASLNRPGGNLTGVTQLSADLTAKRLGLLRDVVAPTTTIAILLSAPPAQINPEFQLQEAQNAARSVGLRVFGVQARDESEFEAAFATAVREGAGGILVSTSVYFGQRREQLSMLALKHRLPAIYQSRDYPVAGGLMSYGPNSIDLFRQVGTYVGRILKGEKPGDLPVQLPTKLELVINLKTAKAAAVTIPSGILAIADEVIE
jgi:putative ABC transport system substrate-binding protein